MKDLDNYAALIQLSEITGMSPTALLDTANHSYTEALGLLHKAIEQEELKKMSHYSHRLKGVCRQLGLTSAMTIACEIELDSSQGNVSIKALMEKADELESLMTMGIQQLTVQIQADEQKSK